MATDNRTLGRFDLVGIPPAPRGVPQIEVTFDIDANGIVHVSAKDLGTGKEQSIKIQTSSGLSEEEIDRMVHDAEAHAEEDKKKEELIKARNEADQFIYATEKTLKEHDDKVSAEEKQEIENKLKALKDVINSDSVDEINKAKEDLAQASHKLAEEMYKEASKAQQQNGAAAGAAGAGGAGGGAHPGSEAGAGAAPDEGSKESEKDGAVDADFEVVDDDKK
jgi:molecular chaperone DnaK